MKFTLGWLKDHLDTNTSLDDIQTRLTALGLEVESVEDRGAPLAPFTVAHVISAERHPDADRLQVCRVDTGKGVVQVVCGAPNARAGMKAAFASPGVTLPGTGLLLKKSAIRGVDSAGMLCSARELGLGEDHGGIIDLPGDAGIGEPIARVLGLDDPVIYIKVTANRPDCLGVRGVARDLAAAGLGKLKPWALTGAAPAKPIPSPIRVYLDFPDGTTNACPHFIGRMIRGVRNQPSPDWLRRRLKAVGLRPISALVDITNFLAIDACRPLHVFDADTIAGSLTVRLAKPGESLPALDGKTYALDPGMTVIADEDGVLSLGGVIGGESTGCTETTTNVFIEAALFDPLRTAATGRKLGIDSDARHRFERGVDPAFVVAGIEAATKMVLDLCGGEAGERVVAGAEPRWQRKVHLRADRLHGLGGITLPLDDSARILTDLGFNNTPDADGLSVEVPSWRPDIEGEPDLVEEVARVYGYDRIPALSLPRESNLPRIARTPTQRREALVRRGLAARGMVEAVTYSFMNASLAEPFGIRDSLKLANPISADLDLMRPSILPNLLEAAKRNADRGLPDLALFEIGPQYAGETAADQSLAATGLRVGQSRPRHWSSHQRKADALDAKADILAALAAAGIGADAAQVATDPPAWYHPGRSGTLRLGPKVIGYFGEIHPRLLTRLDLKGPACGFELNLSALPPSKERAGKARPLLKPSPLLPLERDFAFVVDAAVPAEALLRAARGADRGLISEVSVFDLYEGEGVGPGKKSIAIAVRLQPNDRTLTDADIKAVGQKIVAAVTKATAGTLRA